MDIRCGYARPHSRLTAAQAAAVAALPVVKPSRGFTMARLPFNNDGLHCFWRLPQNVAPAAGTFAFPRRGLFALLQLRHQRVQLLC